MVVDPVVDWLPQNIEAAAVVEYSTMPITVFVYPESVASCSFTAYLLKDYLPGLVLQFQRLCPDRTLLMYFGMHASKRP